MHTIHIKFCGAIFMSTHATLEEAMETYRVLRRRNVREIIIRAGTKMICGTGEYAAMWHVPQTPGEQLAIAAN